MKEWNGHSSLQGREYVGNKFGSRYKSGDTGADQVEDQATFSSEQSTLPRYLSRIDAIEGGAG
jgi:hypothetical protein